MPFKEDGSYYQVCGRSAVYSATLDEVNNIRELPRVPYVYKAKPKPEIQKQVADDVYNDRLNAWLNNHPSFDAQEKEKYLPAAQYEDYLRRIDKQELCERTVYTDEGQKIIKPGVNNRLGTARARALMKKKVSVETKGYRYSMGYNKVCGYYSPCFDCSMFTGSSLNRKFNKQYNESEEKNLHGKAAAFAKVEGKEATWDVGTFRQHERDIFEARIAIAERRNKENRGEHTDGLSCPLCKCELRLCVCAFTAPGKRLNRLSSRTRGKIKDKATAFFRACQGQATFVTLTFINKIKDTDAVKVLNNFITQVRKVHKNLSYLWVAERQNENWKFPGNIHFHIIFSRRLSVNKWNNLWVLEQYNFGLTAENRWGDKITKAEIDQRYKDKTIGDVLNPFDIKKISTIDRLSFYLTKYITKNEDSDGHVNGFQCAAWHCSRTVSRLFTRTVVGLSAFNAARTGKNFSVNKKTGECFYPVVVKKDFWQFVYINNKRFPLKYLDDMENINKLELIGEGVFDSWQDFVMINDEIYRKHFLSEN